MNKDFIATRSAEDMLPVLMNSPKVSSGDTQYYMIRGGSEIKNVTVWRPGCVAPDSPELIKAYGHYHVDGIPETYWIVSGEGYLLLQKRALKKGKPVDNEIVEFEAIKVKAGDKINIAGDMGHTMINTGKEWLITVDDSPVYVSDDASHPKHADYEPVRKLQGFAYYVISNNGKIEFVKNKNYKSVPEIKFS